MNVHDRYFALHTAAAWRSDRNNYDVRMLDGTLTDVKFRCFGREKRMFNGLCWTQHSIQQINHFKDADFTPPACSPPQPPQEHPQRS